MKAFSTEQKLLHKLILHSNDVPSYSLFYGQMGIALTLAHYSKIKSAKPLKYIAQNLIDESLKNINEDVPLGLSKGLCGIGWSIEYLIQNQHMRGDSREICEIIDKKLMTVNIKYVDNIEIDNGLEGWLHYILAHAKSGNLPFPKDYIAEWDFTIHAILNNNTGLSDTFISSANSFIKMCRGEEWCYNLSLLNFIKKDIKSTTNLLGLRNGIAGYIETHYLQKNEKDIYS